MNNKPMLLIVEDDEKICNFISAILASNDYQIIRTARGKEAVSMAASYSPDLILLDLGLPDMDGVEVLRTIRQWSGIPIIVVSARGQEREKVEALDLGADDYLTKPFGTSELLARIRTGIRHSQKNVRVSFPESEKMTVGDLEINYQKRLVAIAGKEIHLTPIEYKIIVLLSKNIGKVLTHDFIMKEIWGPYTNEIQALRVNMANIRRKLEINPAEPRYILTEVGVGYRMVEEI
ncbi:MULTISPECIES: response regulator transcription factor [unclassified Dehalobacter]|uniref:response regulator n=1 Tax=unclassified Dehalobacter TaxID=2635733 RepID=UPI000E6BFDC3|nr:MULTISPECIES: response regulator transcription factor [unclassified Dehalobacter]RJE49288.1 DNA-binding response regulator [Dehalobacter sp. MCB1]TCX53337.1 DNA-binding response regulator [Dehalobacter sp. 14DCB1]TCX54351.1 DNA-binding response regulator [Dehalobacter sp. 12DCB1]